MPTTGKILGQVLRVLLGTELIECEDGFELTIDGEEIDVSCKGSGDWGDTLAGTKTWSLAVNAKLVMDSTNAGFFEMVENLILGTELPVELASHDGLASVVGDRFLSGTAVVTSTSLSGNRNEAATWTATLSGRGPLVTAVRA